MQEPNLLERLRAARSPISLEAPSLFRKLKARKALYGFSAYICEENFVELGIVVEQAKKIDPNIRFELNFNMSNHDCKIYSDEPEIDRFMANFSS